ncbi:MAG: hypothetical protein ABC595_03200 [Candidatus Methanosuratincola petrocarbonis]
MSFAVPPSSNGSQRSSRNLFFLVSARDRRFVKEKISELEGMRVPFIVVCGEKINESNVVYRGVRGKWDAINFGARFVPRDVDVVVLNDVDTRIHGFWYALKHLDNGADLVHCKVKVPNGPQVKFYRIAEPIRKRFHIFASGDLMLMRRGLFERVLPCPPCLAEDSYILFKALEQGYRAYFCTETYVTSKKTSSPIEEEKYKARTTLGIYQALKYTRPPPLIRFFYKLLPLAAPLLAIAGKDGVAWMNGIRKAVKANVTKRHPTKF